MTDKENDSVSFSTSIGRLEYTREELTELMKVFLKKTKKESPFVLEELFRIIKGQKLEPTKSCPLGVGFMVQSLVMKDIPELGWLNPHMNGHGFLTLGNYLYGILLELYFRD